MPRPDGAGARARRPGPSPPPVAPAGRTAPSQHGFPRGPESGPGGRLADRPAGDAHRTSQTPRGTRDAARPPDACLKLCRSPGVPRRGRVPITRRRPSVFASRSLHRHRPRTRGPGALRRAAPRGADASARTGFDGLVRTGPRIGPGSGCSWAPIRARPGAPSRLGVASRTAPGAMATGPPTREPPHLPTSLAGRSPEKLPRLVREVSAWVVGFFVYDVNRLRWLLRIYQS